MRVSGGQRQVRFWEDYIVFQKGGYVYVDRQGNRHPITHEEARKKERDFYAYQAHMDVQRGGADYETAWSGRGFTQAANGKWEYLNYQVDKLK